LHRQRLHAKAKPTPLPPVGRRHRIATDRRPTRCDASVEPSERHAEQSDKDDGTDQESKRLAGSCIAPVNRCWMLQRTTVRRYARWGQRERRSWRAEQASRDSSDRICRARGNAGRAGEHARLITAATTTEFCGGFSKKHTAFVILQRIRFGIISVGTLSAVAMVLPVSSLTTGAVGRRSRFRPA
jgi:hypothetical protein